MAFGWAAISQFHINGSVSVNQLSWHEDKGVVAYFRGGFPINPRGRWRAQQQKKKKKIERKFDCGAKTALNSSDGVRPCEKNNQTVVHFIYEWLWRYVHWQVMFTSESLSSFLLGWPVIYWPLVSKARCPAHRKLSVLFFTFSFFFVLFLSVILSEDNTSAFQVKPNMCQQTCINILWWKAALCFRNTLLSWMLLSRFYLFEALRTE